MDTISKNIKLLHSQNLITYNDGLDLMQKWLSQKSPHIWFLEHDHIYTIGRAGYKKTFKSNISFLNTDRGGSIVYHGPGQRVVYFVCPMKYIAENISVTVNKIETWIILSLQECVPHAQFFPRVHGPGIWMQRCGGILEKVAFIGLRVTKINGEEWLSHGMAINYDSQLINFNLVEVCANAENIAGNINVNIDVLDNELIRALPLSDCQIIY